MDKGTSCPGCGTLKCFAEIERVNNYTILRCPDCGLEFSDPMVNPGSDWYNKAYAVRHAAVDTRIRDYYRWVVAYIPVKGKLLDIGCGEGVFVNYARGKGFDAYGIDFSQKAIEIGKQWYGLVTIHNCDLSEVKEITGCAEGFDIVTFFEVLEHLESPERFLAEVKTVLKADGYVAGSVPFKDRWPFREFNDYPPHHLTRWTETSLRRLFERSGFNVVLVKTGSKFYSYHNFLAYLIRILVYMMFGMYRKGYGTMREETQKVLKNTRVRRFLSIVRPRTIRDIIVWPFAALTYPLVFRWFKGYNIMFIARLKN